MSVGSAAGRQWPSPNGEFVKRVGVIFPVPGRWSVGGGLVDVVDDEVVDGAAGWGEAETQLRAQGWDTKRL